MFSISFYYLSFFNLSWRGHPGPLFVLWFESLQTSRSLQAETDILFLLLCWPHIHLSTATQEGCVAWISVWRFDLSLAGYVRSDWRVRGLRLHSTACWSYFLTPIFVFPTLVYVWNFYSCMCIKWVQVPWRPLRSQIIWGWVTGVCESWCAC